MTTNKIYDAIPDVTFFGSIILAFLLDRYVPIVEVLYFPVTIVGWVITAAGIYAIIRLITTLRDNHTSTDATKPPSLIIKKGAYKVSRNPFYLAYVMTTFGVACILGSLTALATPVICFAVLHFFIIPLEERIMRKKFGWEYEQYQQTVRRWI